MRHPDPHLFLRSSRLALLALCAAISPALLSAADSPAAAPKASTAKAEHPLAGSIGSFDARTGVLELWHLEKKIRVSVPDTAVITKNGAQADRGILTPGAHVVVRGHRIGGVFTAQSVALGTGKKHPAKEAAVVKPIS